MLLTVWYACHTCPQRMSWDANLLRNRRVDVGRWRRNDPGAAVLYTGCECAPIASHGTARQCNLRVRTPAGRRATQYAHRPYVPNMRAGMRASAGTPAACTLQRHGPCGTGPARTVSWRRAGGGGRTIDSELMYSSSEPHRRRVPTACLLRGYGRASTQNDRLRKAVILSSGASIPAQ